MTVAAFALIGAVVLLACLEAAGLLLKHGGAASSLLDDERNSPLYCSAPVDQLALHGPSPAAVPGLPLACLPHRIDYNAPGSSPAKAPEAICALLRFSGLPASTAGEPPCA